MGFEYSIIDDEGKKVELTHNGRTLKFKLVAKKS